MYANGQALCEDLHFRDHAEARVPVQVYHKGKHSDIGFINTFNLHFVQVNKNIYRRDHFTFISRPGY
jgi:hypothetical protein